MDSARSSAWVSWVRCVAVGTLVATAACSDSNGIGPEHDAGLVNQVPPVDDGPDATQPRDDAGLAVRDSGTSADAGIGDPTTCDPLTTHWTFTEFLASRVPFIALARRMHAAFVATGCDETFVVIPGFGATLSSERFEVPSAAVLFSGGSGYAFDASGDLIARWSRDHELPEIYCEGMLPACPLVTRCLLDWDYAKTGRLCVGDDDAGTQDDDAGSDDAGAD